MYALYVLTRASSMETRYDYYYGYIITQELWMCVKKCCNFYNRLADFGGFCCNFYNILGNDATAETNFAIVENGGLAGGGALDFAIEMESGALESCRDEWGAMAKAR